MLDAEFTRALALNEVGALDAAVAICRSLLDQAPDDPRAHYLLGTIAHRQSDWMAAVTHLRLALTLSPDDATYAYALGLSLLGAGDEPRARDAFGASVRLSPNFAAAHNNLGVTLAGADPDMAIASFRRAIWIDPDMADAHFNLARALAQAGRHGDAAAHYRIAASLRPASGGSAI